MQRPCHKVWRHLYILPTLFVFRCGFSLITGWEWIVIVAIVAALVLWGPKKVPELARAIGEAKKEFEKASKEVEETANSLSKIETEPSSDDLLIETAQMLGISTEGKTKAQISQEIVEKVKAGKEHSP